MLKTSIYSTAKQVLCLRALPGYPQGSLELQVISRIAGAWVSWILWLTQTYPLKIVPKTYQDGLWTQKINPLKQAAL